MARCKLQPARKFIFCSSRSATLATDEQNYTLLFRARSRLLIPPLPVPGPGQCCLTMGGCHADGIRENGKNCRREDVVKQLIYIHIPIRAHLKCALYFTGTDCPCPTLHTVYNTTQDTWKHPQPTPLRKSVQNFRFYLNSLSIVDSH